MVLAIATKNTLCCFSRRAVTAPTTARHLQLHKQVPPTGAFMRGRHVRHSSAVHSSVQTAHSSTNPPSHKDDRHASQSQVRSKSTRLPTTSSSLRRVAVEAQRSRGALFKGKGKARHVDPGAETKGLKAYCAAETYDVLKAQELLARDGWTFDVTQTDMFPQVLHARAPSGSDSAQEPGVGDVFVFPSGCLVAWNITENSTRHLVEKLLLPAAGGTHLQNLEEEDLDFIEDPTNETSTIIGDTIILGTRTAVAGSHSSLAADQDANERTPDQMREADTVLAKIAFSSAVARSTKLAVLEQRLAQYFHTTRRIPSTLSAGAQLRFTRAFILRKTGELLALRAQLNLYSELTDALPDLFWDSPHELGLESYYEMVGRALDIGVRIKVLNERMDYASEIAAVLRERLSEKHSSGLEWMIIGLIMIEVGFGIIHLWRESTDREDRVRTERLLQRYLEKELMEDEIK